MEKKSGCLIFDHDGTLVEIDSFGPSKYLLFDGMRELLREFSQDGHKLQVWTARPSSSAKQIMNELEILSFFSDIRGSDHFPSKPSPQGLNELCESFDKRDCLHVGDSAGDILGAVRLGIDCVLAGWNDPAGTQKLLNELLAANLKPTFVAYTLNEYREIVKRKFHV